VRIVLSEPLKKLQGWACSRPMAQAESQIGKKTSVSMHGIHVRHSKSIPRAFAQYQWHTKSISFETIYAYKLLQSTWIRLTSSNSFALQMYTFHSHLDSPGSCPWWWSSLPSLSNFQQEPHALPAHTNKLTLQPGWHCQWQLFLNLLILTCSQPEGNQTRQTLLRSTACMKGIEAMHTQARERGMPREPAHHSGGS